MIISPSVHDLWLQYTAFAAPFKQLYGGGATIRSLANGRKDFIESQTHACSSVIETDTQHDLSKLQFDKKKYDTTFSVFTTLTAHCQRHGRHSTLI